MICNGTPTRYVLWPIRGKKQLPKDEGYARQWKR